MRKLLTGFFIALVVIILALPLMMGWVVSGEFQKRLNNFSYPGIKITLMAYHTGWFSSEATLGIDQTLPDNIRRFSPFNNMSVNHLTYIANLHIYHGPVALASTLTKRHQLFWGQAAVSGRLQLTDPKTFSLNGLSGLETPTRVFALISMTGIPSIALQHGAIKYMNMSQETLLYLGPTLTYFTFDRTLRNMIGTVTMQGVQFAYQALNINVDPYMMTFRMEKDLSGSRQNNYHMQFPQILVQQKEAELASISNMDIFVSQSTNNNIFSSAHTINIGSMRIDNDDFENTKLNWSVQNLNKGALSELRKLLNKGALQTPANQTALQKILPILFSGSRYELKTFQSTMKNGEIEATGYWQFPKTVGLKKSVTDIKQLLMTGEGELTMQLPAPQEGNDLLAAGILSGPGPVLPAGSKPMNTGANFAAVMINMGYTKGYFVKRDDHLLMHLVYNNGNLSINKTK